MVEQYYRFCTIQKNTYPVTVVAHIKEYDTFVFLLDGDTQLYTAPQGDLYKTETEALKALVQKLEEKIQALTQDKQSLLARTQGDSNV